MKDFLLGLKHSPLNTKPNAKRIPITTFRLSEENIEIFNRIYVWLNNNVKNRITRTKSGGISYVGKNFKVPMWDLEQAATWIGITYLDYEGVWRIQFRFEATEKENKRQQYGTQSFREFKKKCLSYGIDLNKYVIDNGSEVKKEIERPLIKMASFGYKDLTFDNVHHIDFHNSYPAGLVNTHPEFKEIIEEMYAKRKQNEVYKAILNHSIGYMQSIKCCNAKWAHLSRDAINDNNKRLRELATRLQKNGRTILSYNTDGIWYMGDIFHGEGEGRELGMWENDHTNCRFRAKSAGSYEFIEDGVYNPIVRGHTKLDEIKPRTDWEWGDIYQPEAAIDMYVWIDGYGIKQINEGEENYDKLWFTV